MLYFKSIIFFHTSLSMPRLRHILFQSRIDLAQEDRLPSLHDTVKVRRLTSIDDETIVIVVMQRGSKGMSTKEEGVRPLPGKQGRRLRKPEQDSDRGTEIPERTLLPERRPHLVYVHTRRTRPFITRLDCSHYE